jgi:tRNA (mo5U34)-methyltransferase
MTTRDLHVSTNREDAQKLVESIPAWHHTFEIAPGVVTPGNYDPGFLIEKMQLPADLSGLRALDIGPSDGFFSLHLRHRGAEVVAVDYRPKELHGFGVMERLSGLDFDYRQGNLYDITPGEFGLFDIVVFFGVLYHLPDMLKALAIIRSVCSGQMFLETHCAVDFAPESAAARYYRERTLNNDVTNFWSPNPQCLADMLFDTVFDVERSETWGDRYFAACVVSDNPARWEKLNLGYGLVPMPE